ncbi:hypothetical protein ARMSODRAFT_980686 [Armillaria solidipes]|uniref:Uncharacterized protein n=1 Tax=Armillaria solidipes TaxID=1076256 RepID=A0A2H3AUK3_9AGAR|nr:hypothetical protein ARMSODRAFT_980686 [Armillaria solidipes]
MAEHIEAIYFSRFDGKYNVDTGAIDQGPGHIESKKLLRNLSIHVCNSWCNCFDVPKDAGGLFIINGYRQLPPKFALRAISIRAQNIDTSHFGTVRTKRHDKIYSSPVLLALAERDSSYKQAMSFEDPSEGQRRIRMGFAAGRPKKTLTQLTIQNRELPVPTL